MPSPSICSNPTTAFSRLVSFASLQLIEPLLQLLATASPHAVALVDHPVHVQDCFARQFHILRHDLCHIRHHLSAFHVFSSARVIAHAAPPSRQDKLI